MPGAALIELLTAGGAPLVPLTPQKKVQASSHTAALPALTAAGASRVQAFTF